MGRHWDLYCKEFEEGQRANSYIRRLKECLDTLKAENAHLLETLAAYVQEHEDYLAGTMEKRLRDALEKIVTAADRLEETLAYMEMLSIARQALKGMVE